MRKILPILLAVIVYLAPLYPVYAQDDASGPAFTKRPIARELTKEMLEKRGANLMALDKDKIASRAALIREKLSKFKDKAKANRTENINNNLNNINKRWTNAMSQNLEQISKILEKLKTKAEEAALNSAIGDAEVAWDEADLALKAQMETDYSIDVNTEATIKEDATIARNALRTDLKSAHTKIVKARQALADAIQVAINSMKGGKSGAK